MTDLSEYLYFDAAAYLDYEIERSAKLLDTLKDQGMLDDDTAKLWTYWHKKVLTDRENYDKYDPETKEHYRNSFLQFVRVLKPITDGVIPEVSDKSSLFVGDAEE
jgi:hypothetical protein